MMENETVEVIYTRDEALYAAFDKVRREAEELVRTRSGIDVYPSTRETMMMPRRTIFQVRVECDGPLDDQTMRVFQGLTERIAELKTGYETRITLHRNPHDEQGHWYCDGDSHSYSALIPSS